MLPGRSRGRDGLQEVCMGGMRGTLDSCLPTYSTVPTYSLLCVAWETLQDSMVMTDYGGRRG